MGALALTPKVSEASSLDLVRHRFGVNYTPSRNWWFCWNDWDASSIRRDLDQLASLGADHLRILLVWPYFQPNPTVVSTVHLHRLDQLMSFMAVRGLDALITVFTGQLSGQYFYPPFAPDRDDFYKNEMVWKAQQLFLTALAATLRPHSNFIGFDIGNEINTCWKAPPPVADAWMQKTLKFMSQVSPGRLHVNGVDHRPWFELDTFSPPALARLQPMPVMHCYPFWTGALRFGGPMDPPSTLLLAGMATLIRSFAGDPRKPIWAGEFNTCIATLSEQEQAAWLELAVTSSIQNGVSWFTYWDSHDLDRRFQFNPVEYTLGLLTHDGRVKQQGYTFKKLADSYRNKAVVFPASPVPLPPTGGTSEDTWRWLLDWMQWKPREHRSGDWPAHLEDNPASYPSPEV